jgi:hypothetical protein
MLYPRDLAATVGNRWLADMMECFLPFVSKYFVRFCASAYYSARGDPRYSDPKLAYGIGLVCI